MLRIDHLYNVIVHKPEATVRRLTARRKVGWKGREGAIETVKHPGTDLSFRSVPPCLELFSGKSDETAFRIQPEVAIVTLTNFIDFVAR